MSVRALVGWLFVVLFSLALATSYRFTLANPDRNAFTKALWSWAEFRGRGEPESAAAFCRGMVWLGYGMAILFLAVALMGNGFTETR